MKKLISLAALAAFLFGVGFVQADDAKKDKKKADRGPDAAFKKADANSDGKLSADEFKKMGEARAKAKGREGKPNAGDKAFKRLDANSDGAVSLEEFKKTSERKKKKDPK
jgi:Ca2+-binding EF-hand superfamily protein